ncbi:hypothetical protein OKW41_004663 [Paraburkholderia sp. UCT70]
MRYPFYNKNLVQTAYLHQSRFCLSRWNVADGAEEPTIVEPVDPFERRNFNGLRIAPRSEAMDHLCLVQAVDRFRQCVIVGVAHAAH